MASYSRVLLRMLPLRRWPLPGLGPVWLSEPQQACRPLWPAANPSFVDRVMGDIERQFQEMEKMSRAFFQATPLPVGKERESPKETSEEEKIACPAGGSNLYRFSVDVAGFTPEEMTVNLEGRKVTVTAKRQRESQSKDSGYWVEHQELRRETLLPPDVDLQAIACSLNPDGQLCIEAPRLASSEAPQHTIPMDVKAADPNPGGEDKPKER